jgi:hypothetical protein
MYLTAPSIARRKIESSFMNFPERKLQGCGEADWLGINGIAAVRDVTPTVAR